MSDAVALTEQDLAILRLVQKDASMSRQEMADALGMSATTLWRRLNDLEAAGVVESRVGILNPEKVGVPVCFIVLVNMVDHDYWLWDRWGCCETQETCNSTKTGFVKGT